MVHGRHSIYFSRQPPIHILGGGGGGGVILTVTLTMKALQCSALYIHTLSLYVVCIKTAKATADRISLWKSIWKFGKGSALRSASE